MDSNRRCRHGLLLCSKCVTIDSAALRMTEIINARIAFTHWDVLSHGCMAFRLDDGTTDDTLYPNRATALKYQLRPCCVFYFRNALGGVNARDIQLFLDINRLAYQNDRIAWVDPESPDIIVSTHGYDVMRNKRVR